MRDAIVTMKKVAVCIVLATLASEANAGCDSCMQQSANTASSNINSAISQLNSTASSSVTATSSVTSAVSAANSAITLAIQTNEKLFRDAVSAAAAQISANIAKNTKAQTELNNHEVMSLIDTMKKISVAELTLKNNFEFNEDIAQPASGLIMADRTVKLAEGEAARNQLYSDYATFAHKHNAEPVTLAEGGPTKYMKDVLALDEGVFSPTPLISKSYISTQEELEAVQHYILLMTNPLPLKPRKPGAASIGELEKDLGRMVWNARVEMVQDVLADELYSKVATVDPTDWRVAYMEETELAENGKVSVMEALRGEIDGRIMTPGWFENIKSMSETGVKRELVFQKASQMKLLWELLKKEDHSVRLLALQATLELEKQRKDIK